MVDAEAFHLRSTIVLNHFKTLALDRVSFTRDLTRPSPSVCQGLHPITLSIAGTSYRDWRFETVIPLIQANYFEEWEIDFGEDSYILNQRCLHLYILNNISGKEKEVFALHSEPSAADDGSVITRYKKNPHVHFKTSPDPISKIHLPLSLVDIEKNSMNFNLLDNYYRLTIDMIIAEFDRFPESDWETLSGLV